MTCELAREAGLGNIVKVEVIGDEKTLFPDNEATLEASKLLVKDVERQTDVAMGETVTEGFTLVNADASWSYGFNDSTRLTLTAFARNLTDEVSRNHTSFVKDQVPLPGRNIGVRVRLAF